MSDHDVPADAPAVADDDEAGEGVPERVVDQQAALADAVEHQRDEGSAAAGG